mgnify:CR=1 FL=1|tara:strand:- start:745 stop:1101 length:357 start_codon:yes stop_codon:yes gene_type:complete
MFEGTAYAATGAAGGGIGYTLMQFAPFLLIFVVFYFLLIRPQQKRMKEHRAMIAAVTRGDEVVTQGGVVGKVTKVTETEATVEIAKDVKIQVIKATLAEVRSRTAPKAANDDKTVSKT